MSTREQAKAYIETRIHIEDRGYSSCCWIWQRGVNHKGYGQACFTGQRYIAHRLAYESVKGPIPPGLVIDHLCRVPACCNPSHLEAVTIRENTLRGNSVTALCASKTHCSNGHAFNEENTVQTGDRRYCSICSRENARKWRRRATLNAKIASAYAKEFFGSAHFRTFQQSRGR